MYFARLGGNSMSNCDSNSGSNARPPCCAIGGSIPELPPSAAIAAAAWDMSSEGGCIAPGCCGKATVAGAAVVVAPMGCPAIGGIPETSGSAENGIRCCGGTYNPAATAASAAEGTAAEAEAAAPAFSWLAISSDAARSVAGSTTPSGCPAISEKFTGGGGTVPATRRVAAMSARSRVVCAVAAALLRLLAAAAWRAAFRARSSCLQRALSTRCASRKGSRCCCGRSRHSCDSSERSFAGFSSGCSARSSGRRPSQKRKNAVFGLRRPAAASSSSSSSPAASEALAGLSLSDTKSLSSADSLPLPLPLSSPPLSSDGTKSSSTSFFRRRFRPPTADAAAAVLAAGSSAVSSAAIVVAVVVVSGGETNEMPPGSDAATSGGMSEDGGGGATVVTSPPKIAAMQRLTPANTQRALAVVEEWVEKLRIVGALSEARCNERFRASLAGAAAEAVAKMVDRSASSASAAAAASSSSAAQQEANATTTATQQLEEDAALAGAAWGVQDVVAEHSGEAHIATEVLGGGSEQSTATAATLKAEARRQVMLCALTRVADELRAGNGSFRTLAAWAECERGGVKRLLRLTAARRERVAAEARRVAEEARVESADAAAEAARQETELEELRKKLAEVRARAAIDGKVLRKELQAHADTQRRVIAERDAEMAAELAALRKRSEAEDQIAAMMATHLESRLGHLQSQVNEWMTRFEADTEERTHALDALKAQKERDLVRLYDVRERTREVSEEIAKHKKAADLQRDMADLERREAASALIIQTCWRAHKARKAYAASKRRMAARGKRGRGGGAAAGRGRGRGGVKLPQLKK